MKTVELIGPPGAGKTTYVTEVLSTSPNCYTDRLETFLGAHLRGIPVRHLPFRRPIARRAFSFIRPSYERSFVATYPGVLETTAAILKHYDDRESVLNYLMREMAWYEYFFRTLADHETYVIDDGLYQFHLRLLPIEGWTAGTIMDRLPLPDKLIFVNAPPEICLDRQASRSRGLASRFEGLSESAAIAEITEMGNCAEKFVEEASNRGCEVEVIRAD